LVGGIGADERNVKSMDSVIENVIEWIRGQEMATLTLTRGILINRVKKLAIERPEECQIIAENKDGSILAHVPVKWVKINPPRELSEETLQKLREVGKNNLKNIRKNPQESC